MLVVLKRILIDLAERKSDIRITLVEENMMGQRDDTTITSVEENIMGQGNDNTSGEENIMETNQKNNTSAGENIMETNQNKDTSAEKNIMGGRNRNRRLKRNRKLVVYYDVRVLRDPRYKSFGPIIIQWIRDSYDYIISQIQDYTTVEYFGAE